MTFIDTWRGEKPPAAVRAFMGWGGLIVSDQSVDVLDMLRAYLERAAGESCGQCFPCRSGLRRLAARLGDLCAGLSRADDLRYLEDLARLVKNSARCDIGQSAPRPLLDVLAVAPQLLEARKTAPGAYASLLTAPCMNACPAHVNVPAYLEDIRLRRFERGLDCVMQNCPMPGAIGRVCVRPCENACRRAPEGRPLAIRHLKRFLFDRQADKNAACASAPRAASSTPASVAASSTPAPKARVAAIGAGPASLACAYYLCRLGFAVTIFEKQAAGGGMARYGIPDYRLPPQVLEQELQVVRALGCEIRYGVDVGRDISLRDLREQGFAALFIGAGAPVAPGMRCEGEEVCTEGYISGIDYLREASLGRQACTGERLVVVGGGNVAMDCVRTALRHGFSDVQLLYRRTEQEMPADKAEIEEAREEGAHFNFLAAPLRILSRNGKVTGLVCRKMRLGEPDASGRRSPLPVEGQDFELPCDAIIHAIGQKPALTHILKDHEGALSARGTLEADSITCQAPGSGLVFGGGDCVTGPATLVAALAAGRRAAKHIAARLSGLEGGPAELESLGALLERLENMDAGEEKPLPDPRPALKVRTLPLEERLAGFDEVELGAEEWEAVREAGRCLRCYRLAMAAFG